MAPDGRVLRAATRRKMIELVERDVERRSEGELRRLLVEDAVKRRATALVWAVAAYERIGKLSRKGADQAYRDVVDEVESITGSRAMPMA